jgi:DNA primase
MSRVFQPLEWKEVNIKLDPSKFNIHTILERVAKKGDLLKGLLDSKNAGKNSAILKRFI